jgi:hypothetical protein
VYHQPLHLIRSVQGLLPSSSGASPLLSRGIPFPDCLLLFSRLGCLGSMPGRGISFLDCLLFSRLGCPGSTLGKGISFPDCLLFSRLGCPGSTPSRGISFRDCLLFNRLGCRSSTPGRGISFRDCLLFSRLGCPSSTPGRGIPFPSCLLLFSELGCLVYLHFFPIFMRLIIYLFYFLFQKNSFSNMFYNILIIKKTYVFLFD